MSEGYGPPPLPPQKPPRSTADAVISILALIVTGLVGVAGAVFGFFMLAFLDYCPPESCSAENAASAVFTAVVVAGLVWLAGTAITVIQLARRKIAWPFAIATFVACNIALVAGAVGYFKATGME